MESWIFKYTEFLLTTHNCIIIPDLGGFIINLEDAIKISDIESHPPKYSLIFNQDLKHNDGFLSSFIQNQENISYEAACKKIKRAVNDIKSELILAKSIRCVGMGEIHLNENNTISFLADKHFVYPLSFGLDSLMLRRLIDIEPIKAISRKEKSKHYIGRMTAAAALVLFFSTPSLNNISNQQSNIINQEANFTYSLPSTFNTIVGNGNTENDNVVGEDIINNTNLVEDMEMDQPKAEKTSLRTYYIIIGSEESKSGLNVLKNRIKKDFPDVTVVETGNKYRLYTASFDEKSEAEDYLSKFRDENPKYKTAWLYSKRNN